MQDKCVFCDKSKIKSIVTERGNCYVFEPLNPVVPGHLLVVHRTHTKDFTDNHYTFAQTAFVASKVAKEMGGDFNLITSKGEAATQSVFHCHIHLVPRSHGDGLKLPWS
jgi:histidine triad (HIT) family protein